MLSGLWPNTQQRLFATNSETEVDVETLHYKSVSYSDGLLIPVM